MAKLPLLLPGNFSLTPAGESVFVTRDGASIRGKMLPAQGVNRTYCFGEYVLLLSSTGTRVVSTSTHSAVFFYPGEYFSFSSTPGGFLLGSGDGSVHKIAIEAGRFLFDRKFQIHRKAILAVAFVQSLGISVAGDENGAVWKFVGNSATLIFQTNTGFVLEIFPVSETAIIVVSSAGQIVHLEISGDERVIQPKFTVQSHGHTVNAAAFTADFVALGGEDGSVNIWTSADGKLVKSERVVDGCITGLAFSEDRKLRGVAYDREFEFSVNF